MSKSRDREYRITVSENQLRVIQLATEWFFRLQLGQFHDIADELALDGWQYDKSDPHNDQKFEAFLKRRNDCKAIMETAYRVAQPALCGKTKDMLTAEDIFVAIRHFRWEEREEPKGHDGVDARPPIFFSGEKPVKVRRATDAEN